MVEISNQRREGDSNPRSPVRGTTVFETAPFDHSGISPDFYKDKKIIKIKNSLLVESFSGERGIRTPGGLAPSTVFKTAAFDHSAISPSAKVIH